MKDELIGYRAREDVRASYSELIGKVIADDSLSDDEILAKVKELLVSRRKALASIAKVAGDGEQAGQAAETESRESLGRLRGVRASRPLNERERAELQRLRGW